MNQYLNRLVAWYDYVVFLRQRIHVWTGVAIISVSQCLTIFGAEPYQYHVGSIQIPSADANEPARERWSLAAGLTYLDQGAEAWTKGKGCISCHTNGSYMMIRPSLTSQVGRPPESMRRLFLEELGSFEKQSTASLRKGIQPTQLAYLAAGLASWDRHINGHQTEETDRALRLMLQAQSEDGSFGNDDCWPPLESSSYHSATVAAIAVAATPGWLEKSASTADVKPAIQRLESFLKNTPPPHAYGRVLLWWANHYWPGLATAEFNEHTVALVTQLQQKDGGWTLRSFADPEDWGDGSRAAKLRAESTFDNPTSDGHMTGLVCMVLRLHGTPSSDPVLHRGLNWLKTNQRVSGRWWTRSLNTDRYHFITYSSTCYALAALAFP